ncbi:MAG: hypothetical protein Q9160_004743 [Pyrenula sp. 1 TL-2023]
MSKYLKGNRPLHNFTPVLLYNKDNWADPASLVHFEIQDYLNGYGYDSSTTPVKLSLAVLMLYSVIVVTFLLYVFITGRSASSWDSIGEIVTLAMNSQRPENRLENTSVGIEALTTFREPVNIRVSRERGAMELVFRDDAGWKESDYKEVEPNMHY